MDDAALVTAFHPVMLRMRRKGRAAALTDDEQPGRDQHAGPSRQGDLALPDRFERIKRRGDIRRSPQQPPLVIRDGG
jgi:hypothetical protein